MDKAYIQMLRVTSGQGNSSMAVDLVLPVCYDIVSAHKGTISAVRSGPSQHKALSFCQSTTANVLTAEQLAWKGVRCWAPDAQTS